MRKQNNEKPPVNLGSILIRVAAGLFCLLLISVYLLGGLFARYVSRGQGADSARVAKFDVKLDGPHGVTCEVTALHPGEVTIEVDNDSEVAVKYSIRVKIHEEAGCGVRVILDYDPAKQLEFAGHVDAELPYTNVGALAVGAAPATHTLSFEPLDWAKITSEVIGESKELTQNFTLFVDVVQID